ncbi:hypothetical protein M513_01000 [Trichuris suis]|uniref:Integrase catalytic domain-containing protein n=1 Tax=Trichuris suis TaxID=68888 RepID=A0A085MLZ1_9BILA|nr:hypothetical protein M513_01000 [Trichuris suis]
MSDADARKSSSPQCLEITGALSSPTDPVERRPLDGEITELSEHAHSFVSISQHGLSGPLRGRRWSKEWSRAADVDVSERMLNAGGSPALPFLTLFFGWGVVSANQLMRNCPITMETGRCVSHTSTINISSLLNALETDGIVETMRKVDGPWTLVFYMVVRFTAPIILAVYITLVVQSKENCLWFGRDCFGRKSLLLYDSIAQEPHLGQEGKLLILSTLHPVDLPGNSVEVPVGRLYCLKLSDMTYSVFQLFSSTPLAVSSCVPGIMPSGITKYEDFNGLFSVSKTSTNSSEERKSREHDEKDLIKHFIKENKVEIEELIARLRRSISCQLNVLPHQSFCGTKSPETTAATVSVLFSGGIDSLLIAVLLGTVLPAGSEVDLLNVAFTVDELHNCSSTVPDRQTGIKGYMALKARCSHVHWNLLLVDVTKKELYDPTVQLHVRRLIKPACTVRDESIGYAIWFASKGKGILYEKASLTDRKDQIQSSARILFLGSGADELFAGYMRHRSCFAEGGYNALAVTLEEELFRIGHRSLSLCDRMISDHCLLVHLPYLNENFVRYVNNIPLDVKTDLSLARGLGDKLILRAALWLLGYEEFCFSLKRAIQFGSRIAKVSGSKGKVFSYCGELVGHYPVCGWLRVATAFIKREANRVSSRWDEPIHDDRIQEHLDGVAREVTKNDPVCGVALEVDNSVIEDGVWLRPSDARHINMAELDAVIKGLNLAIAWRMGTIELMTDSAAVHRWLSDGVSKTVLALVRQYQLTTTVTLVWSMENKADRRTRVPRRCEKSFERLIAEVHHAAGYPGVRRTLYFARRRDPGIAKREWRYGGLEVPKVWQRGGVDVMHWGKELYLTLIDCGPSRFCIWRRLSQHSSTEIARHLESVFYERGAPEELLTDNDTAFQSNEVARLAERWGTRLRFRCAYAACGNGITERCHRTIKVIARRTGFTVQEAVYRQRYLPIHRKGSGGIVDLLHRAKHTLPVCRCDSVWIRPHANGCDTRYDNVFVTRVISDQTMEVDGMPRHVGDIRRRTGTPRQPLGLTFDASGRGVIELHVTRYEDEPGTIRFTVAAEPQPAEQPVTDNSVSQESLQTLQEEGTCASTRAGERMRRGREDETGAEREQRLRANRERMRTTRARLRGEPEAEDVAVREAQRLRKRRGEKTEAERSMRRRVDREHGRSVRQNVASMSRRESISLRCFSAHSKMNKC